MLESSELEIQVIDKINDLNCLSQALTYAETLMPFHASYEGTAADNKILIHGLDTISNILGLEGHADLLGMKLTTENIELSMEGIGAIPGKVWKFVSDALIALARRIRALFNTFVKYFRKSTDRTDKAFVSFEKRLIDADAAIKNLGLEVGSRLTGEQEREVKDLGLTVFLDANNKVLSRAQVESDITRVIPANYRGGKEFLVYLTDGNGNYDDLIASVDNAIAIISSITAYGSRTAYTAYMKKLVSIQTKDEITWFFEEGLKSVEVEDATIVQAIPTRGKAPILSGKPVLGGLYPTYVRETHGFIKMNSMLFSQVQGRIDQNRNPKMPKGYPPISFAAAKKLREQAMEIQTLWMAISNNIAIGNTFLEDIGVSGGSKLKAASDTLDGWLDARTSKDIDMLKQLLRTPSKGHTVAFAYLRTSEQYIRRIGDAINAFLVLCMGTD